MNVCILLFDSVSPVNMPGPVVADRLNFERAARQGAAWKVGRAGGWGGVQNYMRVAPLFETLDDLDNSTETMQALLGCEWYLQHINGEQEVMVGYSDSGKDAGRIAAAWGLYEVQESLIKVARVRPPPPPPTPISASMSSAPFSSFCMQRRIFL